MGPRAARKEPGDLIVERDGLRSVVGAKADPWWVWAALDAGTRQAVAMVAGDRSGSTARCLRDALPDDDRGGAVVCTDFRSAGLAAVPPERHAAAGRGDGLTSRVERLWCAPRPQGARVVRETLSLSKSVGNHAGALWHFVRHYDTSLP